MADENPIGEIRVLDLSEGVAGAYAAKLFADYGADVIKVERPRVGDPTRQHSPFPGDEPNPETGAPWLYLNTNKRGVTLEIGSPKGRELFRQLVERALVIIESFSPGHLASLGLGFRDLTEIKRRIVLVSVTPFGQWGPYAEEPDREPMQGAGYPAEYQAGLHAFAAAAIAVLAADGTDVPQHVDIAAVECMASALGAADPAPTIGDLQAGRLTYPGSPFRLSEVEWQAGRAPLLGEHNREVYCDELGLSRRELARLGTEGVV